MKVVINLNLDAELIHPCRPSKNYRLREDLFGYTMLKISRTESFDIVKVKLSAEDKDSLHLNGSLIESILQIYL